MKKRSIWRSTLALAASAALVCGTAYPQAVETTFAEGTVTEFMPGSAIVLRSDAGPGRYVITEKTTFVDETGAVVEATTISPGVPVKVTYVREGDRMVVSKVVVTKKGRITTEERTTTTPTAHASGTIVSFAPGTERFFVRTETAPAPIGYTFTERTVFVDSAGRTLTRTQIRPGAPVQIITEPGPDDALIASRVVVMEAPAPGGVIIHDHDHDDDDDD